MIQKTPLKALKHFYYVAHYGSVTKASQTLHVTQSAVSKQIKKLENLLDIELFHRVNNHLTLTTKGKRLYETCQNVFSQLDDTLLSINNQATHIEETPLVLSCESTLSMRWLIPRLAKFKNLDNGFDVVLLTACGAIDFRRTGVDIALRRNNFDWGEHIYYEKVVDEYMMVAQSTIYAKDTILLSSSRPKLWKKLRKTGLLNPQFNQYERMELEHFYLCIEGCLAGLGATVASIYMLEKELNYQLLEPISPAIPDDSAYYLLSAEPFYQDQRKVIFKEWLMAEMERTREQIIGKC